MSDQFHDILRRKIDEFVHLTYALTRDFPKEELYGVTSQLRRAALSVVLNYIEGFARFKIKVNINFIETSYGSLKESMYLLEFANEEKYILSQEVYLILKELGDEIGAMLWTTLENKKQAMTTL